MTTSTKRPTGNDVPLTKGDVTGAASSIVDDNLPNGRAVVTSSTGKVVASVTKSSEIDAISGSRADSAAGIADNDKFVHNDGGVMTQTSFNSMWAWIQGKITGAASSILKSNLTTNRVLVSIAGGKVGVANALTAGRALTSDANGLPTISNVTTTELNKLDASLTPESVQVDDDDGFLINIDGNLKQVRGDKVKEYVSLTGVPRVTHRGQTKTSASGMEWVSVGPTPTWTEIVEGRYTMTGLDIKDLTKYALIVEPNCRVNEVTVKSKTELGVRMAWGTNLNGSSFSYTILEWD